MLNERDLGLCPTERGRGSKESYLFRVKKRAKGKIDIEVLRGELKG